EELDQVLAVPRRIARANGRADAARRARGDERRERRGRELRRDGRAAPHGEGLGRGAAPDPEIDDRLDDVPAVEGEERRPPVASQRLLEDGGEALEEPRRPLVRLADPVQVDVVAVVRVVDHRRGAGEVGELRRERGRVEIVHAKPGARPWASLGVAPAAVRRDQDERALARDDDEALRDRIPPRRHVRLVAFRPCPVYLRLPHLGAHTSLLPMRIARLVFLCLVAACVRAPRPERAERAHVYLVVVDGLAARYATPTHMPVLSGVIASEPGRSTFFHAARAIIPARTNPNHVTLVTGVYAEEHGSVGTPSGAVTPAAPPEHPEWADRIEVETLFTVAETTAPDRVTLGVFAKPKLARLFAAAPGQRAPDVLWSPERLPAARRDPA